uniref:PAS domain-containing protein n=1 Tax=Pseudomonas sp. TaxID=306 RepID=UPI00286B21F6
MSNVTPSSSLSALSPATGSPLRGSLKGALAALVLLLLTLLFWQLLDQLRDTQQHQRQYTIDYTADLASQVSLNMALNAQIALNLLPIVEQPQSADEQQALLRKLQKSLPGLRSLALLSPSGKVLTDSTDNSDDADYLSELVRRSHAQAHYFSNANDGSVVHLLLHQASGTTRGYWVLRLTPTFFSSLTKPNETGIRPLWLVENRINHQIISRDDGQPSAIPTVLTADELANSVLTVPLSSSDWQLRGLFDRQRMIEHLLPAFIGKCLLGLAFSLLPFIALLNMRRRQRQVHEGRRRYQDIFDGTGVALCVLDVSGLKSFFDKAQLHSSEHLKAWLDTPEQRQHLLRELRITEVNLVALQLLNVNTCDQAWKLLIDGNPQDGTAIGNQVLDAVLNQQKQLELEIKLQDANGRDQHLWLVLRLPEDQDDYKAVILSITDITSRKLVELSLLEREGFWSDVVRTVPDHLYVQDVISQRMIFSNHHLGQTLGYNRTELHQMGEYFWEILLNPEDADFYHRSRQTQRQAGYRQLMQCQLRFRHRDGKWRRFDIREQALARDKHDQVTRIIGVAKDITDQIEASESLRDSEQRYRMLAESISDVIFSTDSKMALNYVSPSVQAVLGYDADWIFQNGWQSTIANPQQLAGIYSLMDRVSKALNKPEQLALLRSQVQTQLFLFDCLRADGRKIPIELRLVLVWDEHGAFEGVLGVGRDISQQRRAEKDLRMAATVFEHSTSAILITDPAGYIVQANEAFSRVSGYAVEQV